jgi:hypothetical protein
MCDLGCAQTQKEFLLELPRDRERLCEPLLSRRAQRDSQDAPMLRGFPAFDQPLSLERNDQIDDGLRTHADGAGQLRTRDALRLLQAKEHQELGGGQLKGREGGFGTAAHGKLSAL